MRDDFGNHQYRKEESDGHGTVRGTYGYTDANGIFRYVDYVADANGFKASIRSNEPGIGNGQAANIILSAEEPPRNVLDLPTVPRPAALRLPLRARPTESAPVAFVPFERNPILAAGSERSERLRYNLPLPLAHAEAASAPEAVHVSTPSPAPPTTSSPRASRLNRINTISNNQNNNQLNGNHQQ